MSKQGRRSAKRRPTQQDWGAGLEPAQGFSPAVIRKPERAELKLRAE